MENNIKIQWKSVHPDAKIPSLAHPHPLTGDTGYDVYAVEDTTIPPCDHYAGIPLRGPGWVPKKTSVGYGVVPTGLEVAYITPGFWFTIKGKSGLGFNYHLIPHFGVIDNSFRGPLGVKIYNLGNEPYTFKKGDKVAQIVICPLIHADMDWADEKQLTTRGNAGFGSTGR